MPEERRGDWFAEKLQFRVFSLFSVFFLKKSSPGFQSLLLVREERREREREGGEGGT